MNVRFVLPVILILAASILMTTESAFSSGSGIPEPSVPEFAVKFVNASYTVTTKNAYTGLYETEQISNNSIEITIKNQPFDYPDYQLYYKVRTKPHFADNDWTNVSTSILQSNSSHTIIALPVVPTNYYGETGYDLLRPSSRNSDVLHALPDNSQIDFQVETLVGHIAQRWVPDHWMFPDISGHYEDYVAFDTTSGWSETQTGTINNSDSTTNSTVNLNPPDHLTFILAGALILVPIAAGPGLIIHLSKRK